MEAILWIKAFHVIAIVAWFAGLFYLPRLFVYHASIQNDSTYELFLTMERKLYRIIMMPAAIISTVLGLWLLFGLMPYYLKQGWMHAKLALVILLGGYHFYCGLIIKQFQRHNNQHTAKFYRWFNEIPTFILIAVIILVVVKPF